MTFAWRPGSQYDAASTRGADNVLASDSHAQFWSSFNKERIPHFCDSTVASPTARRDNVLASKCEYPPFRYPPFNVPDSLQPAQKVTETVSETVLSNCLWNRLRSPTLETRCREVGGNFLRIRANFLEDILFSLFLRRGRVEDANFFGANCFLCGELLDFVGHLWRWGFWQTMVALFAGMSFFPQSSFKITEVLCMDLF